MVSSMDKKQRAAIASTVRQLRVAADMTRAELAEATGLSPRTVASIDRGEGAPQLESLMAVMRALGHPIDPQDPAVDIAAHLANAEALLRLVAADARPLLHEQIIGLIEATIDHLAAVRNRDAEVTRPKFGAGRKRDEMLQIEDEAAWDE